MQYTIDYSKQKLLAILYTSLHTIEL